MRMLFPKQICKATKKMGNHCLFATGGVFRAGENVNLQILAQRNLCHFFKTSKQIMYGFSDTCTNSEEIIAIAGTT